MLISFGAQPSVKDSNGNTALHLAVLHGNLECVKAILNTNSIESLPLDDFNDEGKCMFFFLHFESFRKNSLQDSSFTMICPCNSPALRHIHKV
jgi:ankyrin repeat protein